MQSFKVTFGQRVQYEVEVDADDAKSAAEKARAKLRDGFARDYILTGDSYSLETVEPVETSK